VPRRLPPDRRLLRGFAAAAAIVAFVPAAGPRAAADVMQTTPPAPHVALFAAPGFPSVDAPPIAQAVLEAALSGFSVARFDSPAALTAGLTREAPDALILPYGSAFPVEAWPALREFIQQGGNLVVLGGAPLEMPVRSGPPDSNGAPTYVAGPRQPTFAREFLIGPADQVATSDLDGPVRIVAANGSTWSALPPVPTRTFALTLRLASIKDLPAEGGSEGQRDAIVRPLVHLVDRDGTPRACPLLAVDRIRGDGAGGRWVLAPSDAALDAPFIRQAVATALDGASAIDARPVRASVVRGEVPHVRILVNRPAPGANESPAASAHLRVFGDAGQTLWEGNVPLSGPPQLRTAVAAIAEGVDLAPGLYHVDVTASGVPWHPVNTTTGFWVRDDALLRTGPALSVSRDWLRADGKVIPIVGTTYMASDVDRKFLFEPNPHVWDADFREMQRRGINFVRTGIWTAWSRAMLNPGAIDENVLSALDAYVQTAAKHGIHVAFTFFAFQPPYFGGTNPFLDPRAIEGQRAFLTLFATRYAGVPWISWDLINEPSYAPADKLWTNQPIGDASEAKAWQAFVRQRHGADDNALRVLWRVPGDDVAAIPKLEDLSWTMIREGRTPRKAYDFTVFSQEAVARWAATLRQVLKQSQPDALVTLGQDEGGTELRPSQQLHAESVDYTAVHTWWNNDDLLWDGVLTKVPEKPNLHQETGMMRLEDVDGNPWRSPEDAARLLERKVAYAFASRGAGAIQWAWNINPYQPIDNESVIGIIRPDGTYKPELRALTNAASFFATAAPWLDDFEPDPVVLVIPHARLFSGRPGGLAATKRVVHVLAERFGVVPTALSDERLTPERLQHARLIVVPDPEVLPQDAAAALVAASQAGALVLVTGHLEGDPYGRVTDALSALGAGGDARAVVQHERTRWGGGWATFDQGQSNWLMRGMFDETASPASKIWREPLPLGFAAEPEPIVSLLGAALAAASVATNVGDAPVAARVLLAPRAALIICVNETPSDVVRRVTVDGRHFAVPVSAGRPRLALVERATGRVIVSTPGGAVERTR
jgi:hypothetical protein